GLTVENALFYEEAQREIEERRMVEQALRESEEHFRIMVEQARDYAIFMLDKEGRISSWNSGAERILGYSEGEILGKDARIIFTPEDREKGVPEEELETSRISGKALDERWHLRKDGSRFFCSGYMFALWDDAGQLRGFTKIMRDTTEKKRREEDIQRLNEELEHRVEQRTAALRESYEQMETFTYTVAHDLRAPLRSMLGFSQAVLEENHDKLDDTSRDFLRRIVRASHRMDALIQDLLAYSHITRTDLRFEPVNLQVVLNDVLQALADEMQSKMVTLVVQTSLPDVFAHRATLQTILMNLISNAVKFSASQPNPRVEVYSELRQEESRTLVRLWIRDNGIGIAPEHHQRIFRVFERLHGPETYRGTGIGLAIVKKGVERMNGQVGVESRQGEGSRFWIELPAA
ncbi:MAG: sensor histidine kinase, partial [Limisphaerales bacterium]